MTSHNMKKCQGFSLVEMAVVLVIVGLLLGGILVPISAQMDLRDYNDEKKSMEQINAALLGFAMANGYLPCPAVSALNGAEDRTGTNCTGNRRNGFLPWATLGLHKLDSWGHLYMYSVTLIYASSATKITLYPAVNGDIRIRSRDSSGAFLDLTTTNNYSPAVFMSMGKNGALAYDENGTQIANASSTNADEIMNATQPTTFVSRTFTENKDPSFGGEFDDVVSWISPYVYVTKMVAAGQLP